MKTLIFFAQLTLLATPVLAQVSQEIHNRCLRAADYSGCVLQQKAAKPVNPEQERRNEVLRAALRMIEEQKRHENQLLRDALQYNPYNNVISPLDAMRLFQ